MAPTSYLTLNIPTPARRHSPAPETAIPPRTAVPLTAFPYKPPASPRIDFSKDVDLSKVAGKNILIVGGSEGIGDSCARLFAQHGAHVTIGGTMTEESLQDQASNNHLSYVQTDLSSHASQVTLFKAAIARSSTQSLDIVITCTDASEGSYQTIDSALPDADFSEPFDSPLQVQQEKQSGAHSTTHLALWYLNDRHLPSTYSTVSRDKCLILLSSANAYDHSASQYGVEGLFRNLRSAFASEMVGDVRVNMVASIGGTMEVDGGEEMGTGEGSGQEVVDLIVRCVVDDSVRDRSVVVVPGRGGIDVGYDWREDVGYRSFKDSFQDEVPDSGVDVRSPYGPV